MAPWGSLNLGMGGAGFNIFTASALGSLATGATGDIGIITTQAVGNVYVGNETVSTPVNNDVLIETTHKNNACPITIVVAGMPITIYPYRCTQYSGGVWVLREFYVKKSTGWTSPYGYLYYNNQEFPAFTGGWQWRGWAATSGVTVTPTTRGLTKNSDHMLLYGSGNNYSTIVAEIATDINLTNFSTLTAVINNAQISTHNGANLTVYLFVAARNATYWHTNAAAKIAYDDTLNVDQTKSLDVSSLNGSYDIGIGIYNFTSTGCQVKIKDVRLA